MKYIRSRRWNFSVCPGIFFLFSSIRKRWIRSFTKYVSPESNTSGPWFRIPNLIGIITRLVVTSKHRAAINVESRVDHGRLCSQGCGYYLLILFLKPARYCKYAHYVSMSNGCFIYLSHGRQNNNNVSRPHARGRERSWLCWKDFFPSISERGGPLAAWHRKSFDHVDRQSMPRLQGRSGCMAGILA